MIRAKYDWIINEKKPDDGFFKLAKKKVLVKTYVGSFMIEEFMMKKN